SARSEGLAAVTSGLEYRVGAESIARPGAPKTEINLAGASIDPDRLIAGQSTGGPIVSVAGNVGGRVINQASTEPVHGAAVRDRYNIIMIMPPYLLRAGAGVPSPEQNERRNNQCRP